MATATNYPIHLPILVIEAQIFVAVKKFPFLPDKLIPTVHWRPAAAARTRLGRGSDPRQHAESFYPIVHKNIPRC